jgi:hypothetical protein
LSRRFGLVCFANKNENYSFHTAYSKPIKEEVNGTVILPPLLFPASTQTITTAIAAAATAIYRSLL